MQDLKNKLRTTTNIFGYNFICDTSYELLAEDIMHDIAQPSTGLTNLITPNAHGINVYRKYPKLNKYCQESRYVLPDGQPIVWLSKFTKNPIKKRLTGSDFFPIMFGKLKQPEHKCLFVVSSEKLKTSFLIEKADARVIVPPFFDMEEQAKIESIANTMANEIKNNGISYAFIGVSEPKQGALARKCVAILESQNYDKACIFFFLGASFEFYFGMKKRAPLIFQKIGLEWFYRLITEPKRTFGRYIFGNISFILLSINWLLNKKSSTRNGIS